MKATQAVRQTGIIFPTISGTVNDWAPTDIATCSVIMPDLGGASRIVTGIDATGFVEGQMLWISAGATAGGGTLTLNHASGSSLSGNRFGCPNGANYAIQQHGGVMVIYSPTVSAANPFRVMGKS
jgi:hypothetical protein